MHLFCSKFSYGINRKKWNCDLRRGWPCVVLKKERGSVWPGELLYTFSALYETCGLLCMNAPNTLLVRNEEHESCCRLETI